MCICVCRTKYEMLFYVPEVRSVREKKASTMLLTETVLFFSKTNNKNHTNANV